MSRSVASRARPRAELPALPLCPCAFASPRCVELARAPRPNPSTLREAQPRMFGCSTARSDLHEYDSLAEPPTLGSPDHCCAPRRSVLASQKATESCVLPYPDFSRKRHDDSAFLRLLLELNDTSFLGPTVVVAIVQHKWQTFARSRSVTAIFVTGLWHVRLRS